ncbi:MAG: DUF2971 domain-containing protein [Bacteroidales bacterium]|nr:DUF2971 domain-containing protein [Bacteroidales bacterium]
MTLKKIKHLALELYEDCQDFKISEIENGFESYLKENCKHLCFSTDYIQPESNFWKNGYDHPTMWAHYGDNSKGVCLVLNKEEFLRENPKLLSDEVNYSPLLKFPRINQDDWQNGEQYYFETFLKTNKQNLFFQKHSHWANEHEYKIVELGKRRYCSIKNSLKGIYLGAEFDVNLKSIYRKFINKNIWVEQIWIDDGQFSTCPADLFINN